MNRLERLALAGLVALAGGVAACERQDALRVPAADSAATDVAALAETRDAGVAGSDAGSDAVTAALEQLLFSQSPPQGVSGPEWPLLRGAYEARRYTPFWVGSAGGLDTVRAALCGVGAMGLRPALYLPAALAGELAEAIGGRLPAATLATLDVRLTTALLTASHDLRDGRVNPRSLLPGWRVAPDAAPADSELLAELGRRHPVELLRARQPVQAEYADVAAALQRYRAMVEAGGWPAVPAGPTLRRGVRDSVRVPALRARLAASGDLADTTGGVAGGALFDAPLAGAVARFQARHGLVADGAVGGGTLAALNVPLEARLRQLETTLELYRWLPDGGTRPYLVIDLAARRLGAWVGDTPNDTMHLAAPDADSAAPLAAADSVRGIERLTASARRAQVVAAALRGTRPRGAQAADGTAALRLVLAGDSAGIVMYPSALPAALLPEETDEALAVGVREPAAIGRFVVEDRRRWDEAPAGVLAARGGLMVFVLAPPAAVRDGAVYFRDGDTAASAAASATGRLSDALGPVGTPAVCGPAGAPASPAATEGARMR